MKRKCIKIGLLLIGVFILCFSINAFASKEIKPTLKVTPNHEENYISLNWEINDKSQPYRYQLYQIREGDEEAHSIQAKDTVKVLNIYPDYHSKNTKVPNTGLSQGQIDLEEKSVPDSGILKTWLSKENIDDVVIETISLTDFNNNPQKYLKKENGLWNYDAVFYGMWNLWSYDVYPNDQAIEHLRTFIHDGGGFMTSHHTIGYVGLDRGVNKLADEMGVEIFSNQPADWPYKEYVGQYPDGTLFSTVSFIILDDSPRDGSTFWPSGDTIEIVKKGYLTEYPFKVGEIGQTYKIPYQHGLNVFGKGDVWMKTVNPTGFRMPFQEITVSPATGEKGTNNFYVHTYNNTAIINSGHSFPQITQAETRIIANTLYYLSQITTNTSWDDRSGQDVAAPEVPHIQTVKYDIYSGKLNFMFKNVKDIGSTYKYYVKATSLNDGTEYNSDIEEVTITSGLKGYSIVVDQNPDTIPDLTIETTKNEYQLDVSYKDDFYIHVAAIDNRNNFSVAHYKVKKPEINIDIQPEKWTNSEVDINIDVSDEIEYFIIPSGEVVRKNRRSFNVSENGFYEIELFDIYGNRIVREVHISNIDNKDPIANILEVNREDSKIKVRLEYRD